MACIWRNFTPNYSSAARRFCLVSQRRHRYKKKWATSLPSKSPSELALEHFDAFYRPVFGSQWPSIRVSLLSLPKYAAVINSASEYNSSVQQLMEQGAVDLIQEAVNLVHKTRRGPEQDTVSKQASSISSNTPADNVDHSAGQSSIGTAEGSQGGEGNQPDGLHCSEDGSASKASSQSVGQTWPVCPAPAQQSASESERLDYRDGDSSDPRVDEMKNLLAPDAVKSSTDLEYFMPTEQVFSEKEQLRLQEYAQSVYHDRAVSVSVVPGQFPSLPKSLRVMAFPPGDVSDFPKPLADASHLLNYYLLDASSILPVLALDVRPGDEVLDLCAAPGGKTLALLQILMAQGGHLSSNDMSQSRVKRLKTVLRSYMLDSVQQDLVTVSERNGLSFRDPIYSKVLVDVPCNSDRHVLVEEDNNLFRPSRQKERLKMTQHQKDLLLAGIRSCRPGGTVVYSTCTLAPVQNDGVVQAAVEELWETSDMDVAVEDLSPLTAVFAPFFQFHAGTRLGLQVVPSLLNNWGPAYCCKLRRLQ